jgi:hypothetical protein
MHSLDWPSDEPEVLQFMPDHLPPRAFEITKDEAEAQVRDFESRDWEFDETERGRAVRR